MSHYSKIKTLELEWSIAIHRSKRGKPTPILRFVLLLFHLTAMLFLQTCAWTAFLITLREVFPTTLFIAQTPTHAPYTRFHALSSQRSSPSNIPCILLSCIYSVFCLQEDTYSLRIGIFICFVQGCTPAPIHTCDKAGAQKVSCWKEGKKEERDGGGRGSWARKEKGKEEDLILYIWH